MTTSKTKKSIELTVEKVKENPDQYHPWWTSRGQNYRDGYMDGMLRGLELALDLVDRDLKEENHEH